MTIWVPVFRAPSLYEVSDSGDFRSKPKIDAKGLLRKQRNLILATSIDGYKRVNLFINGKQSQPLAHRVVYESFFGPIPHGMEINHKNGKRCDNRPENLELLSHAENVRYSKNVLGADYASYGNGRMTPEQRDRIFELRAKGHTHREIGAIVGFSKTQISNVLSHKCWPI